MVQRKNPNWTYFATRYLFPFGLGTFLMAAVNVFILWVFSVQYPTASQTYFRVCVSPLIAALQEPISSKLLPALVVFLWAKRENRLQILYNDRYQLAVIAGATVGVIEALSKNFSVIPPSIDPSLSTFLPVFLHSITGFVVGVSVYSMASPQFERGRSTRILFGVILAIGIHFIWNSQIAFLLAGQSPC